MKKFLLTTALILSVLSIQAQPPQGGGSGRGGMRPLMDRPSSQDDKLWITNFPEIPDITLKQREKLGSTLTKEQKDINKQMKKKRDLDIETNNNLDLYNSDVEKNMKKMAKIDKEIDKIREKTNNKIKSILSPEQFLVFSEKRDEFKFKRFEQRKAMNGGKERPERPEGMPQGPGQQSF